MCDSRAPPLGHLIAPLLCWLYCLPTHTHSRQFRQTYVDDAIVGLEDNFGGGAKYPVDVKADNGVIHTITQVLNPGWSAVNLEAGVGGIANTN